MLNRYDQGQLVRVSVAFTNSVGQAADPSTVVLTWRAKGGAVQTVNNPTRDAVGAYHYDIDTSGVYGAVRYRFVASGSVVASAQGEFYVTPTALD